MNDQNSEVITPAESLRDPASAMKPDPRTSIFVGQSPLSLTSHHSAIAAITLSPGVPLNVAIQFETARNLYLYAWYVYRFYMVAATQALSTLELGLRERLPSRLPEPYQRVRQENATLAGLIGYAIDQGLIRNEGFRRWHESAEHKARQRRSMDAMRTMIDQQLESIEIDETDPPEITPEDQCWDLVSVLRESLPRTRNELAHGSSMLTRQVLGTIELVAEILGQLYPDCDQSRQKLD